MKNFVVERKRNVSPDEIAREHLRGYGVPVIVTGEIEYWSARSKWTFEFFRKKCGADIVAAPLGLGSSIRRLTKLGTYIDFLDAPDVELPGIWVGDGMRPLQSRPPLGGSPPYLVEWRAFHHHPDLYDDISPTPNFITDMVMALSPPIRDVFAQTSKKDFWAVYIGPKGALSPLHQDYWDTHGYLAQIQGRKRVLLFSPEDSQFLYQGHVDPERPDLDRFPLFGRSTIYECVIEPGDTLLMPAGWWHHVRSLEKTITVSHNFFNEANFNNYMKHFLRNIPTLLEYLEKSSILREELGNGRNMRAPSKP